MSRHSLSERLVLLLLLLLVFFPKKCLSMTAQGPGKYQFLLVLIVVPLATPAPVNKLCLRTCLGPEAKWTGMDYFIARQQLSVSKRRGSRSSAYREQPPQSFNYQNKMCPGIVLVQLCLEKDEFMPGKVLFTSTDIHNPALGNVPRHAWIYSYRHSP